MQSSDPARAGAARPDVRLWLPAIALAYLWPVVLQPMGVLFPARSDYTDLLVTHWPNALWLRRALFEYREPPLWNPAILGGQPFAADPLAGLWYPPAWLLLAPGLPLALLFNLLFVLHLAWGGWGMFRFLLAASPEDGSPAEIHGRRLAALFGAAVFMGLPKWMAHLAAGHVSLCFAVAWTPWLLSAVRRAARSGGLRPAARAAAVFALLFLADVRWAILAGLLAAAYWLWLAWPGAGRPGAARSLASAALFAAASLALTAALWLPLLEFQALASRAALTGADSAAYSLPPRYLLGLLLPDLGGFHEWLTYLGFLPLALAAAGGLPRAVERRGEAWFWLAAALLALSLSLGEHTPLFGLARRLMPPLGWLRVPPRAWFVVAFAVAVLAARGAGRLSSIVFGGRAGRRYRLAAVAGIALAWGLAVGTWVLAGRPLPNVLLLAAATTAGLGLIALRASGRLAGRPFLWLALGVTLADLLSVNATLMRAVPASQAFEHGEPAAQFLSQAMQSSDEDGFRVYSPSYSLPQHVAALYGLEQADGVNPLQLRATVDFMSRASGVPAAGYSVTLPPFANGDPATDNAGAIPDAALLGLLGVRYVAAEFDLNAPDLIPAGRFGSTRLYENPLARPRAWIEFAAEAVPNQRAALDAAQAGQAAVEGETGLAGPPGWIPARVARRGLNFLSVETVTEQPGLLALAEVDYPGWRVLVDGQPGRIVRVDGLLRGVFVPAGRHMVEFRFAPLTVLAGAAVSAAAWLALGLFALWPKRTATPPGPRSVA